MVKKLVIVESPAKAKKIKTYLGNDFNVLSSVGHIRDLPIPSKLPQKIKELNNGAYKRFAIDIDDDFKPFYQVYSNKSKTVSELKSALKNADELYLATDEDREGEAIAWHLLEELKPKIPVKRMVFHEITKDAILNSINNTREINYDLVDAQETRRILDRLYGFQISPFLWRKFGTGLSAGRVQSVATRILVNREKERMAFTKASYADIEAVFKSVSGDDKFKAKLSLINQKPIADGKSFNRDGELTQKAKDEEVQILDEAKVLNIIEQIKNSDFIVDKIDKKAYTRKPKAPFTTSTLQQEAINKLHMSSASTMRTAQSLYENGYITYMRTDSPALSKEALDASRSAVVENFGNDSLTPEPVIYATSSANAQEAHEAIRPAGNKFQHPDELASVLDAGQLSLYTLIYNRTLACQMKNATGWTTSLGIKEVNDIAYFNASGTIITDRGFLQAYDYQNKIETDDESKSENRLPDLNVDDILKADELINLAHQTKPPARYTEASLVKEMEKLGIGRPSTYATTIQTIQDRGYVRKVAAALIPTWLAFGVNRVLEDTLEKYVDYDFTAHMEDDLDLIAHGKLKRNSWLKEFWAGNNTDEKLGLEKDTDVLKDLIASKKSDDIIKIGKSGNFQIRVTPYGAIIEDITQTDDEGHYKRGYAPVDLAPDELTDELAKDSVEKGVGIENSGRELGVNPKNGFKVVAVNGKYGPYFTEILPEGTITKGKGAVKAKTAALLKTMELETVTIEDALKVMQLPIELGINPTDEQKIVVNNGRFGPYLMKKDLEATEKNKAAGSKTIKYDFRSIKKTEDEDAESRMFSITLEEAIEIYSQPKVYRRGGFSKKSSSKK